MATPNAMNGLQQRILYAMKRQQLHQMNKIRKTDPVTITKYAKDKNLSEKPRWSGQESSQRTRRNS